MRLILAVWRFAMDLEVRWLPKGEALGNPTEVHEIASELTESAPHIIGFVPNHEEDDDEEDDDVEQRTQECPCRAPSS